MHQRGLTLVELLATLTILGILFHLAAPAFRGLVDQNRQQVTTTELLDTLKAARTTAIQRNQSVIVQPLQGDWGCGWRIIADVSGRGLADPDNPVLVVRQKSGAVRVMPGFRFREWVRFNGLGVPSYAGGGLGNGSLYVCDGMTGAMHRRVVVAPVGRLHLSDSPGDSGDLCLSRSS